MKEKRIWSIEEKIIILKDIEKTGVVEGFRKHGIYATTYYDWKKKFNDKGADGLVPVTDGNQKRRPSFRYSNRYYNCFQIVL